MMDYLVIQDEIQIEFSHRTNGRVLGPFGNINVLVGKNNSGKSRFLRSVFVGENYSVFDTKIRHKEWETFISQNINEIAHLGSYYGIINTHQRNYHEYSKSLREKFLNGESNEQFIEFVGSLELFPNQNHVSFPILQGNNNNHEILRIIQNTSQSLRSYLQVMNHGNHLYIPILRGLRPIQQDSMVFTNQDVYASRTKKDYLLSRETSLIYTGLSIYEDVKKLLLGSEEERTIIAEFQVFLEEFIFDEKVLLIPKYDTDVLHIKIGNQQQLEIFNLGDGLQTIISILFPIFFRKNDAFTVFIEEPETHLHPEWQAKLLRALKQFEQHQFFISSHSSVFINDSLTSVFSIVNEGEKIFVDSVAENNMFEVLKDLGYKPSDLLLSNYVLWVEGQSDKIYWNKWIQLAAPHLEEGRHYSIMVLGGENYRHLLSGEEGGFNLKLIEKINPNFGIILDSDRTTAKEKLTEQKEHIKKLFDEKGAFCWITEYREIENYIQDDLFYKAVKQYSQKVNIEIKNDPFDNRNKVVDLDAQPSFKANIKIPETFFKQIQKKGPDAIKEANVRDLRALLLEALNKNNSQEFEINKIYVAKVVSKNTKEVPDKIKTNLELLITKIEKANNI